jgi:hypothetical protein
MNALIRIGGLLRCCVETFRDAQTQGTLPASGVLPCKYCKSSLRLADDGVWEWNHD